MNEQECRLLLSKFSHEVRNPVTLINSFLQLLVREHPEISSYPFYEKITENMTLLTRLLDEMSHFNNATRIHREDTDLQALLAELADSGNCTLFPQNIQIVLNADPAVPHISADRTKLLQVFYNLIRNAAEAMPEGGEIQIRLTADHTEVQIEVANPGPDIPAEYLPDLFEPFVTHKKEGTGLGLAICREILQAHKGTISVTSSGGITRFTIFLPIDCQ